MRELDVVFRLDAAFAIRHLIRVTHVQTLRPGADSFLTADWYSRCGADDNRHGTSRVDTCAAGDGGALQRGGDRSAPVVCADLRTSRLFCWPHAAVESAAVRASRGARRA